jgi:hypothetical protein
MMAFGMGALSWIEALLSVMSSISAKETTGKVVMTVITAGNIGSIIGFGATGFIYSVDPGALKLRGTAVNLGHCD